MSRETLETLNTNTLIGFTDKRGNAWHYRAELQGDVPNHYAGAVPVADVLSRLFSWQAVETPLYVQAPAADILTATGMDDGGAPVMLTAVPNRKAIVRSDTFDVLGVFKDGYQPHQYGEWLVEKVAALIGAGVDIGSAGLLRGGAVAWVQIEGTDTLTTRSGLDYRPNVLASTSCDGSLATSYRIVCGVVVCDNTLDAALGERTDVVRVKHSRYSHLKMDDARDTLRILDQSAETFGATMDALADWTVSDAQWVKFLDATCPVNLDAKTTRGATLAEQKRDAIDGLYRHDNRVTPWTGSALGVLQATNTYAHHVQTVRGASRSERNMMNAITGETGKVDGATLDTLRQVCELV